jgi:hypothetical protein
MPGGVRLPVLLAGYVSGALDAGHGKTTLQE